MLVEDGRRLEGEVRVWRGVVDAEFVAVDVRVGLVEGLEEGRGVGIPVGRGRKEKERKKRGKRKKEGRRKRVVERFIFRAPWRGVRKDLHTLSGGCYLGGV